MKKALFGSLLIVLVFPTLSFNPSETGKSSRLLMWGLNSIQYSVSEKNYMLSDVISGEGQPRFILDKGHVKEIFADFDGLKFNKIICNRQSTEVDHYVIKVSAPSGTHQVAWIDFKKDLGKKGSSMKKFWTMLMELTRLDQEK